MAIKHRGPKVKPAPAPAQPVLRCAGCLSWPKRLAMMGIFTPKDGKPIQVYYLCARCATQVGTPTLTAKIESYITSKEIK